MAKGLSKRKWKEKSKGNTSRKQKNKERKLADINAKTISRAQKRHLKEFGELHPVDESDELAKFSKRRKVVSIEEEDNNGGVSVQNPPTNENGAEESDGEEVNLYQKLVTSLHLGSGTYLSLLRKKQREEAGKEEDEPSDEGVGNKLDNEELEASGREGVTSKTGEGTVEGDDENSRNGEESNEEDDVENEDHDIQDATDNEASEDDSGDKLKQSSSTGPTDPFSVHFEQDLDEDFETQLKEGNNTTQNIVSMPSLGRVTKISPSVPVPSADINISEHTTLQDIKVKARLCESWSTVNESTEGVLTTLQQELMFFLNSYKDVFFSNRTFDNGEEIRRLYCLHAINHILKTRSRILKNNAKIVQAQKEKRELGDLRDQGLTRPKVLILLPFREAALRTVTMLIKLMSSDGECQVMNRKRFSDEFREEEGAQPSRETVPEDFKHMFAGNIDDCFRLGISLMRKSVKLYSEFYSSDIIVASPLGLRMIIGSEGEKSRDYDFLSSIEVLILDQTDVYLMQNWEHVQHVVEHLHLQPKDSHDVDFSRVRMWCLNGWSKYYRQTVMFSSFVSPEMNSLFNRHCRNYAGKVKAVVGEVSGSICQVVTQVPQVFHRIKASSYVQSHDDRFEYFISKILPEYKGSLMGRTAIFISSYFDFVRLRNYFTREGIDFAQISEYTSRGDISRARTSFFHTTKPFLLFTERFYFFYRYRIRGIRNIIFYDLPHYPTFYQEILNFMDTESTKDQSASSVSSVTCTSLYTKFSPHRLAGVVGTKRCRHMLSSTKDVHMFVTGDT